MSSKNSKTDSDLSTFQSQFLSEKNLTLEGVVFLSCTQLKKELKKVTMSLEDEKTLRKIRKRGREKWLHVRECEELGGNIENLKEQYYSLKEEKLQLEEEIEKLKIKCFLASDNSTYSYNWDGGAEIDSANVQEVLNYFS